MIETVIVAFSMFSALPMPRIEWNDKNMRYSLCAFPLVGLAVGLLCWLWTVVCGALAIPALLRGAGLCVLPVLVTGGIHLDGYADTCDALASHGTEEERQRILKDPHMGAFAGIRLCVYFVLTLALWTALPVYRPWAIMAGFCLSRTLSALALTLFPLRSGSGLARTFADAADKKRVRAILLALTAALCAVIIFSDGWPMLPAALVVLLWYKRMARRRFGGLSGDLAGWFLQTAELWMLGALCLWQYGEALL